MLKLAAILGLPALVGLSACGTPEETRTRLNVSCTVGPALYPEHAVEIRAACAAAKSTAIAFDLGDE